MQNSVLKRDIIDKVLPYLGTQNIIVFHGARQVGKTYLLYFLENYLKEKERETYYFDLEDSRYLDVLNAGIDPFLDFLKGEGQNLEELKKNGQKLYVLIDEIQYLEAPSPFLKLLADHHRYLQLIVSGSSSFNIKTKFSDSLTGRTVNFEIFPLNFNEFLRFKNKSFNLTEELDEFHLGEIKKLYLEYVNCGSYPKIVLENDLSKKEKYLLQIIDTYVRKDIRDLAKINNISKFNDLLRILSSQQGQLLNIQNLANDLGLAPKTIQKYLYFLEETFILKLLPPFSTSVKIEVSKATKVFFYDTGLAKMLWQKSLSGPISVSIFETNIFSQLVKKYGSDQIHYWRNKNGNEIDFILRKDGKILPMEVKLNFNHFPSRPMAAFCQKYKLHDFLVIGLDGGKKSAEFIYPWEL